jgi:hypothetical protein
MNYVLVGSIEAEDLSFATLKLARKTRAHLILSGNQVYVSENEKERFETNLTKHSDHCSIKSFKREDNNKTILKEKEKTSIVCPRYYTRCRVKGNCNY